MLRLSVNINKIGTLRNARGGRIPDVVQAGMACERYGAEGITVHPRPDERHIRGSDVSALKASLSVELNVEGYPDARYMSLVEAVRPAQATLVPDPPEALTSSAGWDLAKHASFLGDVVSRLRGWGIRSSLFVEAAAGLMEAAKATGADRIELFTGPYAEAQAGSASEPVEAVLSRYRAAAVQAQALGLGLNAGHDLNRENLGLFLAQVPHIAEVSIGHALISDALYYGLGNSIGMYLRITQGAWQKKDDKDELRMSQDESG